MMRFFKSVGAASLCAVGLAFAFIVILHIRPVSLAGWIVLGLLALTAFAAALIAYRWMMGAEFYPQDSEGSHGEGYATGVGFGRASRRRRDEDDDPDASLRRGSSGADDAGGEEGLL
ncbi:MAG TPA: hypothetical protein DF715_09570 [Oceanicaulis sp.]|jgi:hypothetical protein|uniref:Uncharacterized protein n=1 Tax=Glycocaulis albus TaxID=1382801 RepID=A0ABQ1XJL0_9PROT|nr:hypothetical protein [Glycocaulis albus]MBV5259200.1 hypothetical protein [Synechococcus moorigangaii CMS01]GGG95413.1 hypothetical protein GCM10007420_08720 [Glycocaulis albus]HCY55752.1 hypothetical protein [Oceanicaulis sp.]